MTLSGSLVAALLAAGLIVGGCEEKKEAPAVKPTAAAPGTPTAAPAAKVEYANFKCPIMGGAIVAADVTKDLTREWKGLKVAFCCPACPGPWDKLTDAQKAAKLKPVLNAGVKLPEMEAATKPAAETTAKPAPDATAKAPAAKPAESKPAETKPAK
jgi:hypothetical protein